MEEPLEAWRTSARFNLGESGHRPRTLSNILALSGVEPGEFLTKDLGETLLRDSPHRGSLKLRELVAAMHPGASVENVLITTGSSEALFLYFHVKRHSRVALIMPAFQLLYEIPRSLGADIVSLQVSFDEKGRPLPVAELWGSWEKQLRSTRPDCLVLNHPHNPTGLVFSEDELMRCLDLCEELEIEVIGDEHYRFLTQNDPLGPTVFDQKSPAKRKNEISATGSFVKGTGTPGLRLGWFVGPAATASAMRSLKDYTTHTVSPLVERIAEVVLQDIKSPLFREVRLEWESNCRLLEEFCNTSARWKGCAPSGGLVSCLFPKAPLSVKDLADLEKSLLGQGLFLLNLETMEWGSQPGFRIGIGSPELESALRLLENFG